MCCRYAGRDEGQRSGGVTSKCVAGEREVSRRAGLALNRLDANSAKSGADTRPTPMAHAPVRQLSLRALVVGGNLDQREP